VDARGFGVIPHSVQQDGLADTAEPHHEDAFGGKSAANPRDSDSDGFT